MKPKALLIGGSGQLGNELQRQGSEEWGVAAPARSELDASNFAALAECVTSFRPHLILNCSAFHVVDLCESRFLDALTINAVTVSVLAKAAEQIGARFVTISTDYVFDGASRTPYREVDVSNPIQAYGISKVAGERAALLGHPEGAFVVRTCGLYGRTTSRQKSGNFVTNRLSDARTRTVVEVGSDLVCTPTSASDLAAAILTLLRTGAQPGLYHLTNTGACDWATFTSEIYKLAKVSTRVIAVDRGGRYAPARRPSYTVLDTHKAREVGVSMRPWQEALADYISGAN
ncbi:MAG: dTDP-4-dehydrorhamnose reductase [Proteobacteria bacterium]|nr:dTDP-4-dehydrorhamnose reductase [Pseudomonadota bacterium]